ncbi:MAG: NfeD family protein [Clostridiales bacterium]|nr:hypothetical protein [Eubacteriales bacterium]MDH7566089.1 NfeD family protein [Clostridiales bacterium]
MLYVYIGCLTFGLLFSVMSAFFGGHGFDHGGVDHGGFGHEAAGGQGADGHADAPSPFNPLVIASAVATFGTVGIVSKTAFGTGDLLSLIFALAFAGLVGAAIFFGVVKLMYGSQSNSTFSHEDLIGIDAEVVTPIGSRGMGEVAYVFNGERHNMPARSADDEEMARGEVVRIKSISGNVALVKRKVTLEDIDLVNGFSNESRRGNKNENA